VIKKIYSFFLIILILVSSPFLIRYLLINKKIRLLNNIYFNFPGIITKNKKCPTYDALLNQNLDDSFSVSIINNNGTMISSYNDEVTRLPASNQKLFSSAYVLSKYKLNNNLKTSLLKKNKNNYYLLGQGDPDLNYENIIELISNVKENKIINFNIVEIDSKLYWPIGWTNTDKLYEYGAPISSLAIESNHNKYDDIYALKNFIKNYLENKFSGSIVNIDFFDSDIYDLYPQSYDSDGYLILEFRHKNAYQSSSVDETSFSEGDGSILNLTFLINPNDSISSALLTIPKSSVSADSYNFSIGESYPLDMNFWTIEESLQINF